MILIKRGTEPTKLKAVRNKQLTVLRALGREPKSREITGYQVVGDTLWRSQFFKCCYCEKRIELSYNDVEHYRTKAEADRRPGSTASHGYWWLAFSWKNLLLSCDCCNRSHKKTRFPLASGIVMLAEATPPGGEVPLLLDPAAGINPVEHIEFVRNVATKKWTPRPRNGSQLGLWTIEVCGLDRLQLLELYNCFYETQILPQVRRLLDAVGAGDRSRVQHEFKCAMAMLAPQSEYVGLSYDVFRDHVPAACLLPLIGTGWPEPAQVAL